MSHWKKYEYLPRRTYVDPSNGGGKQFRKVGYNKNIIICQNIIWNQQLLLRCKFIDMELKGSFSVKFILKEILKCNVTLQIHNLSYTKDLWN